MSSAEVTLSDDGIIQRKLVISDEIYRVLDIRDHWEGRSYKEIELSRAEALGLALAIINHKGVLPYGTVPAVQ
jgi:hypothetical protein